MVGKEGNARFRVAGTERRPDGSYVEGAEGRDIIMEERLNLGAGGRRTVGGGGDWDVDVGGAVGEPAELSVEFLFGEEY